MATMVKIGSKQFVFGLTWRSLYGNVPLVQRIGALARELHSKLYVTVDGDDTHTPSWGGFISTADKSALNASGVLYSAAALFAHSGLAKESAILLGEAAGGYYMVALRSGVPAAGYEMWSREAEDIQKRAQHFIEATGGGALTLLGRSSHFEMRPDPVSLELLSSDSELLDKARLRSTDQIPKWKLALLPALLVLGLVAWQLHVQMKARNELALATVQNLSQSPDRQYKTAVKRELAAGIVQAPDFHKAVQDALLLPVEIGGWQMESMDCDTTQCTLRYRRKSGTYESFPEVMGVKLNFGKVGEFETLEAVKTISPYKTPQDAGSWPIESAFQISFGARIQQWITHGFTWKVGTPVAWSLPAGMASSQISHDLLLKAGTWEMSGSLWTLDLLTQLPPNLSVQTLNMTLKGATGNIVARGQYHVKADAS